MEEQTKPKKRKGFIRVDNYDRTHGYIGDDEFFAQEISGVTYLFREIDRQLLRVVNHNAHNNGAVATPMRWDSDLVRRLGKKYDYSTTREDLH